MFEPNKFGGVGKKSAAPLCSWLLLLLFSCSLCLFASPCFKVVGTGGATCAMARRYLLPNHRAYHRAARRDGARGGQW